MARSKSQSRKGKDRVADASTLPSSTETMTKEKGTKKQSKLRSRKGKDGAAEEQNASIVPSSTKSSTSKAKGTMPGSKSQSRKGKDGAAEEQNASTPNSSTKSTMTKAKGRRKRSKSQSQKEKDGTAAEEQNASTPTSSTEPTVAKAEGRRKRQSRKEKDGASEEQKTSTPTSSTEPTTTKAKVAKKSRPRKKKDAAAKEPNAKASTLTTSTKSNVPKKKKQQTKHSKKNETPSKRVLSKSEKAKRAKYAREDEEEAHLESLLFGGSGTFNAAADDDSDEGIPTLENHSGQGEADSDDDKSMDEGNEYNPKSGFMIDRAGDDSGDKETIDAEAEMEEDGVTHSHKQNQDALHSKQGNTPKPVWVDEDDAKVQVDLMNTNRLKKLRNNLSEDTTLEGTEFTKRLRTRFNDSSTANTNWAKFNPADKDPRENSVEDEIENAMKVTVQDLLQDSSPLTDESAAHVLPSGQIQMFRCKDANQHDYNNSCVEVTQFHKGSIGVGGKHLMMTAGMDKTLRFFQVDGEENKKVQGIRFKDMPILNASFLGNTGNVVLAGRRPFYYIYDAVSGKVEKVPKILNREEKSLETFETSPDGRIIAFVGNDGHIILVCARTNHWITDFKMNGNVRALAFSPDGDYLMSSGSDGEIYRWDLRSHRCLSRLRNDDGTPTTSLALSSNFMAVGAASGVVNLYDTNKMYNAVSSFGGNFNRKQQEPVRSIMNIRTKIDKLLFNPDGQVLAMASRYDKDQGFKLMHVPSQTVFSNWPTTKTPLNSVMSMDFSSNGEYLSVGNVKGKCLLYRLNYYANN